MNPINPPSSVQHISPLPVTLKPIPIAEAPDELFQQLVQTQQSMLEHKYMTMPDTENHPAYQPYATVVKDGKVVATIDNNGGTITSNVIGAQLRDLPGDVN